MRIEFKKMGINGEGIGYINHTPIFCDGVLPNEIAEVRIIEDKKKYKKAELIKLIKHTKDRIKPICPHMKDCGACKLMHLKPHAQTKAKIDILREALYKYAHIPSNKIGKMHNGEDLYYRNQCKLPFAEVNGKLVNGMYKAGSNHFVQIDTCFVHEKRLEEIRKEILMILNKHHYHAYNQKTKDGLRYIVLRYLNHKAQCTFITKDTIKKETIDAIMAIKDMDGLFTSINTEKDSVDIFKGTVKCLAGNPTLSFPIEDIEFSLSPRAFFQLNTKQALALYKMAIQKIDPSFNMVEAYAGIAAMSMLAKDKVKHITAIESIEEAVENATQSAKANHIKHIDFLCADASIGLYKAARKEYIDTLLVDPPRSGLDDKMLEAILTTAPHTMIYISCNPSTLAKNLAILKKDYHIISIIPFDLFPQTPHIETLVKLVRK
ncbi:MAG: 23S rRNA (uracil(1939)-C(5))-methyltransferase RlmD [Solobacterium sp.]|nr:23S rRNA (uracil(1939)-C(5))-methyltransferase RlmD [Solobacterium sp.]